MQCTCVCMVYVCIVVSLHAHTSTSLLRMHACECVDSGYILLFAASRLIHSNGPKWYTNDGSIHTYVHTLLTTDMEIQPIIVKIQQLDHTRSIQI